MTSSEIIAGCDDKKMRSGHKAITSTYSRWAGVIKLRYSMFHRLMPTCEGFGQFQFQPAPYPATTA
jgi:hypothetical protein